MTTYTATINPDNFPGTSAADVFVVNNESFLNTGDVFSGAGGTDTLRLVSTDANYHAYYFNSVTLTSIEALVFIASGAAVMQATFWGAQFGATGISSSLAVTGDLNSTDWIAVGEINGTFNAAGWTLSTWDTNDIVSLDGVTSVATSDIITGTSGSDLISGNGGDDILIGGNGADNLIGGAGNDSLDGGAGADAIDGSAGDDTLRPGDDYVADVIDGGANYDIVDYSGITENGMMLLLHVGGARDYFTFAAHPNRDSYFNIEELIGTQAGDWVDLGSVGTVGRGGAGDDLLVALNSGQTLYGGAGRDFFAAENGRSYTIGDFNVSEDYFLGTSSFSAATIDGADTLLTLNGGGTIRVTGVTSLTLSQWNALYTNGTAFYDNSGSANTTSGGAVNDWMWGGTGNDTLSGLAGHDTLLGGLGDDTLNGGDGNDRLEGGSGTNALNGGEGDDYLIGGSGNDTFNGGNGVDTISYERATSGVGLDINGSGATNAGTDSSSNVENLVGSAFADNLSGDGNANVIWGGAGFDTIYGWGGNDTLYADAGGASLNGGDGNDTLNGSSTSDSLYGGAGQDHHYGNDGADYIEVEAGGVQSGETYDGGAGSDTLAMWHNGGAELFDFSATTVSSIDNISFLAGGGISTTLAMNASQVGAGFSNTLAVNGAGLPNIVRVTATSAANYSLAGWTFTNWSANDYVDLVGSSSADTITGTSAADVITGNNGADTLRGGAGADTMDGGDGDDTIVFSSSDFVAGESYIGGLGSDTLELIAGSSFSAASATISSIERFTFAGGSGSSAVQFAASHIGSGLSANLVITGSSLEDYFVVGLSSAGTLDLSGFTFANWSSSFDRVEVLGSAGDDTITGTTGHDNLFGNDGNDTLYGGGEVNSLYGGAGNDVLYAGDNGSFLSGGTGVDALHGGAGADYVEANNDLAGDTIEGGNGSDTLSLSSQQTGDVVFDLRQATVSGFEQFWLSATSAARTQTILNASQVSLAFSSDVFIVATTLEDNITIEGGGTYSIAGWDLWAGRWDGGDSITHNGSSGADNIAGSSQNDIFNTGAGVDTLNGGGGNDYISAGADNDIINGGTGADTATFDANVETSTWQRNADGTWTVTSADGVDTLSNVEYLEFANDTIHLNRASQTFTGDGTSDLILRNSTTGVLSAWFLNGPSITGAGMGSISAAWTREGSGDFNGDGRADILWRDTAGNVALWQMNGASVTGFGVGNVSTDWVIESVGDFDGDTRADIFWRNATTGVTSIWFMNGAAFGGGGSFGNVAGNWIVEDTADYNGDGRDDILWRNSSTGDMSIWMMDGLAVTGGAFGNIGADWVVEGSGDFNGDSNADILWRNSGTGEVSLWYMNGQTVTSTTNIGHELEWAVAAIGDYDGDGRDDILWWHDTGVLRAWYFDGGDHTVQNLTTLSQDWVINPGG